MPHAPVHEVKGDTYILKQKLNLLEAVAATAGFACCQQQNVYEAFNEEGKAEYTIKEKSNCLCRCCCNPHHKFQLDVHEGNEDGKILMTMFHPFRWCCCICHESCRGKMIVYDGEVNAWENDEEGPVIATSQQPMGGGGFTPTFNIYDGAYEEKKDAAYKITGPFCCIAGLVGDLCFPPTFKILHPKDDKGENVLAEIKKNKPEDAKGVLKQIFSDADEFTINMPKGSSGKTKAAVLAQALLIDYSFFENNGNVYCDLFKKELVCVCTYCYCWGCLMPCKCILSFDNNDNNN
mmetsp:Transcript_18067/g.32361  ORF Transcript_18067/g.32361 Transcript_18067/m.32361 type:complete len:292 (+) Transcript_18067:84-959(+)